MHMKEMYDTKTDSSRTPKRNIQSLDPNGWGPFYPNERTQFDKEQIKQTCCVNDNASIAINRRFR